MNGTRKKTVATDVAKADTLADLDTAFAPVASSKNLTWKGYQLEHYRIPDNAQSGWKYFTNHIVAFNHSGTYKEVISSTGGRRTVFRKPGDTIIYPADFQSAAQNPISFYQTIFYFEPAFFQRVAEDLVEGSTFELVPQPTLENEEFVCDAIKYLLQEVKSGGAMGKLYSESIATALAVRLIKLYSVERPFVRQYKGGLSKFNLRLTVEFINENLSENLSLNTLAALCDLSQFHFARAFKQSTGCAPHQYVLQQKIERAKQLLIETSLSVAEIAHQSGFADQSHFTKIFRRHTGATPTAFQIKAR